MSQPTQQFKSKYIYRLLRKDWHPLTPDIININDHYIEYKRRNWFLISSDIQAFHFQNIIGVDINKGLFGAAITIKSSGNTSIKAHGFSKKAANQIKAVCDHCIKVNTQRSTIEVLSDAIYQNRPQMDVTDEMRKLKALMDEGVISREEFDEQKKKLLGKY